MWKLVTDLKEEKQALAIALSLRGQARATALEIKAGKLNDKDGMKVLLKTLDEVYKKDDVDIAYSVYTKFENFRRVDGMSMTDYIVEFERLYHLCKKHNMALPDAVLTCSAPPQNWRSISKSLQSFKLDFTELAITSSVYHLPISNYYSTKRSDRLGFTRL